MFGGGCCAGGCGLWGEVGVFEEQLVVADLQKAGTGRNCWDRPYGSAASGLTCTLGYFRFDVNTFGGISSTLSGLQLIFVGFSDTKRRLLR